jgi:CheY-like chemotaxis protein
VAKQNLLLVDADLRSLRVLEVSLRKAGYSVATASDAKSALEMMELSKPDLILSDTRLPHMDGFAFMTEIHRHPELAGVPVIFLSSDTSVESKVKGLELGVEDYLTKPIYIKEIIARVNLALQRKRREGIELKDQANKQKFTGSLSDIGVVDLLQTIDNGKKSGVLYLASSGQRAAIYFRAGGPVDAELGSLRGARAIYRALVWTEGTFEIDFREVRREDAIQTSTQGVLMEGMRRLDEWGRLLEQLPELDCVLEVNAQELLDRLAEIPDEINAILKHFDGERSLLQVVDACDQDDLETLTAVSKLYFEGLILNTGRRTSTKPGKASTRPARSLPTTESRSGPAPAPESAAPVNMAHQDAAAEKSRTTLDYSKDQDEPTPENPSPGKGKRRGREEPITLTGLSMAPAAPAANVLQFPRREAANTDAHADGPLDEAAPDLDPFAEPKAPNAVSAAVADSNEDAEDAALDEAHDERAAPRLMRLKRQRKRRKRLSLTTSPGMLSSIDPSALLAEESDVEAVDDEPEAPSQPQAAPPALPRPPTLREPGTQALENDGIRTMPPPVPVTSVTPRSTAPKAPAREREQTPLLAPTPPVPASFIDERTSSVPSAPVRPSTAPTPTSVTTTHDPLPPRALPPTVRVSAEAFRPPPPSAAPVPGTAAEPALVIPRASAVPSSDPAWANTTLRPPIRRNRSALLYPAGLLVAAFVGYLLASKAEPVPPMAVGDTPPSAAVPAPPAPAPAATPPATTPATPAPAPTQEAPTPSATEDTAPPAVDPAVIEDLLARAKKLESAGRAKPALAIYEQAAALAPEHSVVLGRMALWYLNRGRDKDAAEYASKATAADATNSEGWIVLGAARDQEGDHKGAQDAYKQCVDQGRGDYVAECKRMLR